MSMPVDPLARRGCDGPHADGREGPAVRLALAALWFYRAAISPWLGPRCRFVPSCSLYARDAIRGHGLPVGLWLTLGRLARCHPWHPGGYDPAPLPRRLVSPPLASLASEGRPREFPDA